MSRNVASFVHIINPYPADPGSPAEFAQQVTLASMLNAQVFSSGQPAVQLAATFFPDERLSMPDGFTKFSSLERSVLDVGRFTRPNKLPLLADILQVAWKESGADYVIYTNADIAVQPHYYRVIAAILSICPTSITITRRTLLQPYHSIADLHRMYLDPGEPHRGWDCFVFPGK